ncbi:hypothetical protein BKA82DRAFT_145085 [Pisolithus tinctorius]|nr:hypothetical protein BKA82DRAFT_145085 [Pisolithus tinctorius]
MAILPYPINLTPKPSELHPMCPVKDRLERWQPHPNIVQALNILPEFQDRVREVTLRGWNKSTRASYGAGLLIYHVFCDSRNVPEEERAPVDTNLISTFISSLAGSYSGKTIHRYIYSVQAWHTLNGLPWILHKDQIVVMLKGAAKIAPPSSKQNLHKPITVQMICDFHKQLQATDPLDTAVFACLTTIFYAASRVGEFTTKQIDAFDPTQHITPNGVHEDIDCNGLSTTVFFLPSTKANSKGEEVNWAKQSGPSDPHDTLLRHLQMNEALFTYKKDGEHRPLTCHTFISRLKKLAKAAGYDHVHGHGLRIGATLEYLLRGIPFEVMKVKGRWASDTFQLYLRKHNQILAPYIQAMPTETAAKFIRIVMPPVR